MFAAEGTAAVAGTRYAPGAWPAAVASLAKHVAVSDTCSWWRGFCLDVPVTMAADMFTRGMAAIAVPGEQQQHGAIAQGVAEKSEQGTNGRACCLNHTLSST